MLRKLLPALAVSAAIALPASGALAEGGRPMHVRGAVERLADGTLTVRTRAGGLADIALPEGIRIAGVAAAKISDIHEGDYVGIASLPDAQGMAGALEVAIFPPAMKGAGEGSYGWDLKPKSTMTNGSVANAVTGVDGRTVTVAYKGQDKTIAIPEGTPVVTFAPASAADLVPGAAVFIAADETAGGLEAKTVVVGRNGVAPPM